MKIEMVQRFFLPSGFPNALRKQPGTQVVVGSPGTLMNRCPTTDLSGQNDQGVLAGSRLAGGWTGVMRRVKWVDAPPSDALLAGFGLSGRL